MKKLLSFIALLLAIGFALSCKGAPPPVEPPPVVAPPPPPPPPPPPEVESGDKEGPVLTAAFDSGLFSPNRDGKNDEIVINLTAEDESDIWSWMLKIFDPESNQLFYEMSGQGAPPVELLWDGRSNNYDLERAGELVQSSSNYTYSFSATDSIGNTSEIKGTVAIPDIAGPVLSAKFSPEFFSPDEDGENDELFITLNAEDVSGVQSWTIKIFQPNSTSNLFYETSGDGAPPAKLTWDGRSNTSGQTGELVQSASDYGWAFSAVDTRDNENTIRGSVETGALSPIKVDILVIKDGDRLKVQVPSIVFAANSGGFDGLPPEVIENNDYILGRIATVLNKFETYKVDVEGHTNPVARSQRERQREQVTDQRLSTQRAQTVVDYLVNLGVDSSRLKAVGIGGARTLVPFEDRENWWKNRRVEFILIK
ncbi:hypothetical protein AGMMS50267_15400 [Spirochaetia bacterium]|nr:hypothetical protein AGMMS50267_15400 [Spirochaetia bacterium]